MLLKFAYSFDQIYPYSYFQASSETLLHSQVRSTRRKSLTSKYGEDLVSLRYRFVLATRQRLKTIELVIEQTNWEPSPVDPTE